MAREKGLLVGTTGVFLNDPMGGLSEGAVIESVQHRAVSFEAEFMQHLRPFINQREVAVAVWKCNTWGK